MNIVTTTPVEEKKEQVLMDEQGKKLLKQLYLKRSYSGNEEAIRTAITSFLENINIPYINYNGNILGFNHPGAPLFSAHLDMVNTERYKLAPGESEVNEGYVFTLDNKTNIRLYRDKDKKCQTSLGADDKNGIWVILQLLQLGKEINFAFCHSEEIGGAGSTQIVEDEELGEFIANCKYGIIIDRRNAHDIIGYGNSYCMGLDDRLESFAKERGYGYKCAHGSISDADRFSKIIECVNLSCGYYEPHLSSEYTNLNELWNTLQFCIDMVDNFHYHSVSPDRMQSFKKCTSPYKKAVATTYSYYSKWDKSEEKEPEKKTTASHSYAGYYKGDQKKTSQATKTMKTITTTGDGTDIDDIIPVINEYFYDAFANGATYVPKLDGFLVPLVEDSDTLKAEDVITYDTCTCGHNIMLMQQSIDELYQSYYNKDRHKVYGFCENCYNLTDLTDTVKHLM